MMWDVFICHASQDKEAVARPLANRLRLAGVKVWLDEMVLQIGDSIREEIDHGLARSRYGIVIISPAFFSKAWTQAELGALLGKESVESQVVMPVWHGISVDEVREHSPLLADRVAAAWADGIDTVVARILEVVQPSGHPEGPPSWSLRGFSTSLRVIGPPDMAYNSLAWAAGDTQRFWWPHQRAYWPPSIERVATVGTFARAFETLGYRSCADAAAETGHEKVAIHADESGIPTHAARQVASGKWTSKLGTMELVEYDTADLLSSTYGRAVLFLKRRAEDAA